MGPFSPNNILVLLCTGLLIQLCSLPLIAADPTPLEKLYSLVKEGAKGDCTAQLADLKTSYTAGLAMAQAAIDAIDAVKNGKMSNWVKTSKNNRRAQMLQAMFQIRAAGITHPMSSEDSTNLGKVQQTYQAMIDNANFDFEGLFWLYCGDDYFTHYNPTDKDPSYIGPKDPPPTVAENTPRLAQYGGWFDGSINWFKSLKVDEQRSDVFCKSNTGAFTIRNFQSITWCPGSFSGFSNGHKYLKNIDSIQQNQKQIKKFDPLKNYESLASTWVHEWTHLQSGTADQPAYDAKSNPIAGEKTYGFFSCVNLARKKVTSNAGPNDPASQSGKSLAIANADSYAYFAMAMYLDKWDWSDGFAQNALGL